MGHSLVLQDDVVRLIEKEISDRTRESTRINAVYELEMRALLTAACRLGKKLRPAITGAIREIVADRRQPDSVKGAAMLAYAATAVPSKHTVTFFSELLGTAPRSLLFALSQSLTLLAKNCCQTVDYVIASIEPLSDLLTKAISVHRRVSNWEDRFEAELVVTELRAGISRIEEILTAFEEFMSPGSSDSNSRKELSA